MTRGASRTLLCLAIAAGAACRKTPAVPPLSELYGRGYAALETGDLREAQRLADEGVARAGSAADAPGVRSFQVLQAEVLMKRRDAERVLAILDSPEPSGTTPEVHVRSLMTSGFARCQLAKHERRSKAAALEQLSEAERLAGGLNAEPLLAEVWIRKGSCFLGDESLHPAAEVLFQRALGVGTKAGLRHLQANAAGSLGLLRIRDARYDDAADWLERSLALSSGLHADTIDTKVLVNLGWAYTLLGDYEKALPFLEQAEEKARSNGYTEELELSLFHQGTCHFQRGDLARARQKFTDGLGVARILKRKGDQREALEVLQAAALRSGQRAEAEAYEREAAELGANGAPPSLIEAQLRVEQRDYAQAERLYKAVYTANRSVEGRWRALAGLARLYALAARPVDATRAFRQADLAAERLRAERNEDSSKFLLYSSLTEFYGHYAAFLFDQGRGADALAIVERNRGRVLWADHAPGAGQRAGSPRFQAIARASRAVLLSYWVGERSFLWVVTPHSTEMHELPSASVLRTRVERYQTRIARFEDPAVLRDAEAMELYDLVIGPAAAHIPPGSRVVVVADGPLHQLSFDTLVVPRPQPHYWLEDVVGMRAPSLSVLSPAVPRRAAKEPRLLVIGNPVEASPMFPALPYAGLEIKAVESHFAKASTVVIGGAQATPAAFREAKPGLFDVIHFVAHVTSNPERPLESAIVLSQGGAEYKLYAREIATLPIRAEAVVLSACRGAGSRSYGGEGLVGFAWAFLRAGAHHVIAGLWDVEDASTARLMDALHRGLAEGQAPPEALRAARLQLLRSTGSAHHKPYYWGPFAVFVQQ